MKNQIKVSLLFVMIFLFGHGYAQKVNDQNQHAVERELTLKQQLAILNAGKDNPVKAQQLERDDRMNHQAMASEKDFGPSNDKAQPLEQEERRPDNQQQINVPESPVMPLANEGTNSQPVGVKSETVINYRGENGGNSQSQPEKSGNAIDYKSIKGGNEQPVGKIPEK